MTTEKSQKNTEQRDKLLDIARELFATKGYEATTTRKINQLAHSSDGLLYYYFPGGKKELLDTVLQGTKNKRVAAIEAFKFANVTTPSDVQAEVMRFFELVWDNLVNKTNYQVFTITVREQNLLNDQQTDWIQQLNDIILTQLTNFLEQQRDLLQLKEANVELMSRTLIANMQSLIFTELVMKGNQTLDDNIVAELNKQVGFILKVNTAN